MKKIKFEKKILLSAILITAIPLLLSYIIFVNDKNDTQNQDIKIMLKNIAITIDNDKYIKEKLYSKEDDGYIQRYANNLINNIEDVDIIVVGDMDGIKYSHLDESQIGDKFVNPDYKEALKGNSYYSVMTGSMGETLRWFQPISYNDKQIGFVMVGKFYSDILEIQFKTRLHYFLLFLLTFIFVVICAKVFARVTKKSILDMEPEEISKLYKQMDIVLSNTQNAIISFDNDGNINQVNKTCYVMFDNFNKDSVHNVLDKHLDLRQSFTMKEFLMMNKKVFITMKPILQGKQYLGSIVVITDGENIRKVAKEITGIDEVIRGLRASVHEFKNNLHVILGLIQIEQYSEAKKFILKLQSLQEDNSMEFNSIYDSFVKALLTSRKLIAKEKNISFSLTPDSRLEYEHGVIESEDIITILGNLLENAYESCVESKESNKKVEVIIKEDNDSILIGVKDNGTPFKLSVDEMIKEGCSSKGEGRGTGLYLVKNRVDLFNGSMEIKSEDGIKSFMVRLYK